MPASAPPILVPLDGSETAEIAVPVAVALARTWHQPVLFVHVAEDVPPSAGLELIEAGNAFDAYARERIAPKAGGVEWRTLTVPGPVAAALTGIAEGTARGVRASIIVMAVPARERGLPETPDALLRATTVPVLLLPERAPRDLANRPIIVGLDGSTPSHHGLRVARKVRRALRGPLVLFRACPGPAEEDPDPAVVYLSRVARAGEEFIRATGDPSRELRATAEAIDAGIIAVACGQRGLCGRLLIGSTTESLLHPLERALLVVPRRVR